MTEVLHASAHAQLIEVARKWLRRYKRCPLVITEMVTAARETPDAIGWLRGGRSVVIECKTSRADFRADAAKVFRRLPERGMGDYRYFLIFPDLLALEDLPPGWGLLVVGAKGVSIVRESHRDGCRCSNGDHEPAFSEKSVSGEFAMMLSLVRRLAGPGVHGRATVDIEPYTNDEHGERVHVPAPSEPFSTLGPPEAE